MALFQLDSAQFEELKKSIDNMSENLAKWQAEQTDAIQSGFVSLIAALSGVDVAEVQQRINATTENVKSVREKLQTSVDNQTKGENDNAS